MMVHIALPADGATGLPQVIAVRGRQSRTQASRYRCEMFLRIEPLAADEPKFVMVADLRLEQN